MPETSTLVPDGGSASGTNGVALHAGSTLVPDGFGAIVASETIEMPFHDDTQSDTAHLDSNAAAADVPAMDRRGHTFESRGSLEQQPTAVERPSKRNKVAHLPPSDQTVKEYVTAIIVACIKKV